jgi:hypothetical protein
VKLLYTMAYVQFFAATLMFIYNYVKEQTQTILAYFPEFKVGLSNHQSVCLSLSVSLCVCMSVSLCVSVSSTNNV